MKFIWKAPFSLSTSLALVMLGGCSTLTNPPTDQTDPSSTEPSSATVITLTQVGCQFLETESEDYQFTTTKAEDCNEINANTLNDRQKTFKPLELKAGQYIFRVTNQNVPYELGFYLRGEGSSKARLPKASGGGLTQGATADYEITLKPGNYVFSCPLNPTPDYPLFVE